MKRLAIPLAFALLSCAHHDDHAGESIEQRYLDDPSFRRAELETSLVTRDNGYARLRLAHYGTQDDHDWDHAREWNPVVEPVVDGVALDASLGPTARALDLASPSLGRDAFARYPVQLLSSVERAHALSDYGVWRDDSRGIGGLVRARLADGSSGVFLTCSSCHARVDDAGHLVDGLPNVHLDLGRLAYDTSSTKDARVLSWGPGRLDVTSNDGSEPVRIPDLRPIRWLTHLHADGNVVQRDLVVLAIRIETLILTSHHELLRPPREVALSLARYLWSFADTAPSPSTTDEAVRQGASIFDARCAACHAPPGFTGPPIALDVVGTDPTIGRSLDRATGFYRVPSLRFVGTRGPLLHDASLPSLEALFDPTRLDAGYRGGTYGAGSVGGHRFGLDLVASERAALIAYLKSL